MGLWEVNWVGKKNAVPSEKSGRMEPSTPAWWRALAPLRPPVTSDVALGAADGLDRCVSAPKGRAWPPAAGVRGNVGAGLGGALAWPPSALAGPAPLAARRGGQAPRALCTARREPPDRFPR